MSTSDRHKEGGRRTNPILGIRRWVSLARNLGSINLARILWSEWTGGSVRIVVAASDQHPGMTLRAGTSDIPVFVQVYREREYSLPLREPVRTIIDAGANIGLSSLYFAARYPQAHIISIEPEPSNFELLRTNVADHSLVTPLQIALAAADGELQITDPGLGSWGFRSWGGEAVRDGGVTVPALCLNSILDLYGINRVNVLKMDIEGAEKDILECCVPWIDRVDVLVAELHDRFRPGCSAAFAEATRSFDLRWTQGELAIAARSHAIDAPVILRPPFKVAGNFQ
jgi:FkbM family methyltransferase